jgi:hypothetical protein
MSLLIRLAALMVLQEHVDSEGPHFQIFITSRNQLNSSLRLVFALAGGRELGAGRMVLVSALERVLPLKSNAEREVEAVCTLLLELN